MTNPKENYFETIYTFNTVTKSNTCFYCFQMKLSRHCTAHFTVLKDNEQIITITWTFQSIILCLITKIKLKTENKLMQMLVNMWGFLHVPCKHIHCTSSWLCCACVMQVMHLQESLLFSCPAVCYCLCVGVHLQCLRQLASGQAPAGGWFPHQTVCYIVCVFVPVRTVCKN